jgi:predicted metal-dependent peptidase
MAENTFQTIAPNMNLIETLSVKLIYENPFYGQLMMQFEKVEDPKLPAPMGVSIEDGVIKLYYNEKFLNEIMEIEKNDKGSPYEPLLAICEHECMHIIFKHIIRCQDRSDVVLLNGMPIRLWNVATDIAINQLITKRMPSCGLTPEKLGVDKGHKAEKYYELLKKKMKKAPPQQCSGSGSGKNQKNDDGSGGGSGDESDSKDQNGGNSGSQCLDTHDGWKEVASEADKQSELENQVIKNAIKKAYEQSKKFGNTPSSVIEEVKELLKPSVVPWRQILRQFVGQAVKVMELSTWKKVNRRFGEAQKGHNSIKSIRIAVAVDTSGSISEDDFQDFINEILSIKSSYPSEIEIIEADCAVHKIYKLQKQVDTKFKGRGGTSFKPVFEHYESKESKFKPNLLIYLTDLYGDFPGYKPKYPVIWCATKNSDSNVPFGKIVKIAQH